MITTRERPGALDELLTEQGAEVIAVPLIEIIDPEDGGASLAEALALTFWDWVVVTSPNGAGRLVAALQAIGADTLDNPATRVAAVGTATAEVLTNALHRPVDLIPEIQRATGLLEAFGSAAAEPTRILLAQADRAEPTLAEGLRARGHQVETVIAYRTRARQPTAGEIDAALSADAVLFASGSAAQAWAEAIGVRTPPEVVAIGPTTARVATDSGLKVTAISADHSLRGLVETTIDRFAPDP